MQRKAFEIAVRSLAAEAGLRKIARGNRPGEAWVGVHSGIFVVLQLDAVRLHAEFTSPESKNAPAEHELSQPNELVKAEASETKPITEAFRRTSQLGIPADWFDQNDIGPWGFQLIIDEARRGELARNDLSGLLNYIAADLHELGAEESKGCCECAGPATELAYIESLGEQPLLAPYCDACWAALQKTTRGVVKKAPPSKELLAFGVLAIGVVIMAAVWGYAQHPEFGVPIVLLILGCAGAGAGLAAMTIEVAKGSNLRLRLGVIVGVLLATLVGNIIGIKLLANFKELKVTWFQAVPMYLRDYLPNHLGQESLYFSGGVIGAMIALYMMRESERMRVR